MAIQRQTKALDNEGISRAGKSPVSFRRSENLNQVFGGGKFGRGRFSRKAIQREKNL